MVQDPEAQRQKIEALCLRLHAKGLILISGEGINGSACLQTAQLEEFKSELTDDFADLVFKDTLGTPSAFLKLKVKLRPEIVTMGAPDLIPKNNDSHVSPQEWQEKLIEQPQILDVRNRYEVEIGKFEGAKDLSLEDFAQFPQKLKSATFDKDKETLIYCTGGIRCEKAILEMRRQGFSKVSQLSGGIIKYLEEFGSNGNYTGECFVFDYRVAITPEMEPSQKFRLCPHCGQPASDVITCKMCQTPQQVCEACVKSDLSHETCSKNCAHHFRQGHRSKKRQQLGSARS